MQENEIITLIRDRGRLSLQPQLYHGVAGKDVLG